VIIFIKQTLSFRNTAINIKKFVSFLCSAFLHTPFNLNESTTLIFSLFTLLSLQSNLLLDEKNNENGLDAKEKKGKLQKLA
jgi:hypothetical protein